MANIVKPEVALTQLTKNGSRAEKHESGTTSYTAAVIWPFSLRKHFLNHPLSCCPWDVTVPGTRHGAYPSPSRAYGVIFSSLLLRDMTES